MTTPPDPQQPFGANQPPYPGSYPVTPQAGGPAPVQPGSVALAVKLMLAGAVLSVLSLAYSLTTLGGLKDQIREQLVEDDPDVSQSTIDAVYAASITFAVVFGLIGAFLWAWMAWKNGQGRGWARIVATVLAGFNVVGALFAFSAANTEPLALVGTVISLVIAVVVTVLLWRPDASRFYQAVAESRRLR